ncbi:MAG: BMC domain-containing protein [Clostridiales bacterium]|nr:BMC domain-containing protein [Clostridiales bacterium]
MYALGMIESNSIPAGIEGGDAMLKAADVALRTAQVVCAGKYIVLVSGDVAAVRHAVEAGAEVLQTTLVDSFVIPNVHEKVIAALSAATFVDNPAAIGILESFSLVAAVQCADAAVKAADVDLIEVRLGRGMGGKSFVLMTGEVAAVRVAIAAAEAMEEIAGMLARTVIIPSPHPDLINALL